MAIDVNKLSLTELESLISTATKRKTTLKKRKPIGVVRSKLAAAAEREGYSLDELFAAQTGGSSASASAGTHSRASKQPASKTGKKASTKTAKTARKKLGKVPPKYRNPANPTETWTGRGKQPRWLAAYTTKGRKVDEFLIKK